MAETVPARTVGELMAQPVSVPPGETLRIVARMMRDGDIGHVVVIDDDALFGVVTDRDIVVRALADGRDVDETSIGDMCSGRPVTVSSGEPLQRAVTLMREHAVRRLPVVDDGRLVGVISLGDLAIERDETTALADISAARANS